MRQRTYPIGKLLRLNNTKSFDNIPNLFDCLGQSVFSSSTTEVHFELINQC